MARRIRKQESPKTTKQAGAAPELTDKQIARADPETYFVTAYPPITLVELSKVTGWAYDTLRTRASRGKWTSKRDAWLARVRERAIEATAETTGSRIAEANNRHIRLGQGAQGIGAQLFNRAGELLRDDRVELRPTDAARAAATVMKAGVEIERKGLGLADQVVHVENARQFVAVLMVVLQRHLSGQPDVLEVVVDDLKAELASEEAKAAKLIEAAHQDK